MRSAKGFTLVELMVTLVVAAIVVTVAIPSFRDLIISTSVTSDRDKLFNALLFARSEAIKQNKFVNVCKSTNQTSCNNAAGWHAGWILYVDKDNDSALDAGEILRVYPAMSSGISVAAAASLPTQLRFNGMGRLQTGNGTLTFSHTSNNPRFQRQITIDRTGRVSM